MKFLKSAVFFASMYAVSVNADPVYLNCTVSDGTNSNKIDITLDESNQKVSYTVINTGFTEKLSGAFTADKVLFVSNPEKVTEMHYEISRNDLSISRSLPKMKEMIGTDKRESGTCTIVKASKNRKF